MRIEGVLRPETALLLTLAASDGMVTVPMLAQGLLECGMLNV